MERNLGMLLGRVHELSTRWLLDEMARTGLKGLAPSHGDIFAVLFARGEATMHELAAFAHRTKPTMTVLVDKLAKKGLVIREKSPADARTTIVRLTPEGEALRPVFRKISRHYVSMLYAGLDPAESEMLEHLLEKIIVTHTPQP